MANSPTLTEVQSYRNDVLQHKIACILPPCPTCHTMPDAFQRHEARAREFYVLIDQLIQEVPCLVIRWRCPGCKKTFTQQPPFAYPHKRYVLETILDLAGCYLEEDASTYRNVVLQDNMPIFHASPDDNTINDKSLAHTTLYRWITSLGGLKEILRSAQDLILQENPASAVCRHLATLDIPARKYVKAARETILKHCRRIIHAEVEYRTIFFASIFPFLATQCAWK